MSLDTLRQLRISGYTPPYVWVLVGPAKKWLDDTVSRVLVLDSDCPERMDFRPLVGLEVDLIETGDREPLFLRTWEALDAAHAKVRGFVRRNEIMGLSDAHELCLKKIQRILF